MEPTIKSLHIAFNALLDVVEPARAQQVLRHATKLLLEDGQRRIGSKKDPEAWVPVREQLRAAMQARGMTNDDLAAELGLSVSAVQKASGLNGPVPSSDVIARVQRWLASRDVENTRPAAAANGHVVERRPHAGRLSEHDRERLAAHAQFTDERELRRTLGLTSAVIDQAIAGREVPSEVAERITGWLAAQGNGAR